MQNQTSNVLPVFSETIWSDWGPLERLRRQAKSWFICLPDRGWFGLTPLQSHLLICGYPRAGTTMLQAMCERAWPEARCFGCEVLGWRAGAYRWRNHAMLISKAPHDVFYLHRLKNFYHNRDATLFPIMLIRDPRDVLTSFHEATGPSQYFLEPNDWQKWHEHVCLYQNDPDVLVLRYENLVSDSATVQRKIEQFVGKRGKVSFDQFHDQLPGPFDTRALNGVRPIDRKGIGRWRAEKHRSRIAAILRQLPNLPDILVGQGYEPDHDWVSDYSGPRYHEVA